MVDAFRNAGCECSKLTQAIEQIACDIACSQLAFETDELDKLLTDVSDVSDKLSVDDITGVTGEIDAAINKEAFNKLGEKPKLTVWHLTVDTLQFD